MSESTSTVSTGVQHGLRIAHSLARSRYGQLAAVILVGGLLRITLFEYVGIWLDHGFYAYDTRLILEGKTPFVDFLGRSPLFLYLLAGWRDLLGYSPATFRAFIGILWLLTTLPVYGLARRASDHGMAITAAALYAWLPYSLVYSQWMNTMALAALLSLTALWLVVVRDRTRWWPVVGVLLGLAFLARRSAIAIVAACVLIVAVDVRRDRHGLRTALARVSALSAAFLATLVVGYWLVVGARWPALFEVHAVNLFLTTGRGGWPLLGANPPPVGNTVQQGRIPIFNDLCQLCGRWTARTIAKGTLVTLPAVGLTTAAALRYATQRWFDSDMLPYLYAPLAALAGYAAVASFLAGFWTRVAAILALAACIAVAYRTDLPQLRLTHNRPLFVVVGSFAVLGYAYLYRERALHVYYGMDLWPLLAILAGLAGVAVWRRLERPGRVVLAAALVVAILTSSVAAYPLANVVQSGNQAGWFTPDTIRAYQDEIDARTEPGDIVLTETATHIAGTEARMPLDDSRSTAHFYSVFTSGRGPMATTYANLSEGMRTGRVQLVIRDTLITDLIADNETVQRLYETNYCRVPDRDTQNLYDRTNTTLYTYRPDCPERLTPQINASHDRAGNSDT